MPPAPVRIPPGFVIAVDFGTSNTSVFCLETRSGNVEPVPLMDDGKERRETILFAPDNVDQRYWQAIKLDGVSNNLAIRNLKTLVREQTEGARSKLEFYLQAMLRNGIEDYLQGRNPDDERSVEFVFTVPVLDGEDGEQHRMYRGTLLDCARTVGYEDPARRWAVRTVLEPDGGALDIISDPQHVQRLTDGERMLIVDVGGGTTDVTLGRVRLTGRPRLEDVENVSISYAGSQFGGEVATYRLGWTWAHADDDGALPQGADKEPIGEANQRRKVGLLVKYWLRDEKRSLEAESWTELDSVYRYDAPDNWGHRFDLWPEMQRVKHELSDEAARRTGQSWRIPPAEIDAKVPGVAPLKWKFPIELLDRSVNAAAQDIALGIESFLKSRGIQMREVAHVAVIGGSARLEQIRLALARLFPNKVMPVGSYVDVAVCRGATRIHQAPPTVMPVGFDLRVGDLRVEILAPGASAAKVSRRAVRLTAPAGRAVEVGVECRMQDGQIFPFVNFRIEDGFDGEVVGLVSSSSVRLFTMTATAPERAYEVNLK